MALQKVQSQSITLDDPITSRQKHGIQKLAANRTKCDHYPGKKKLLISVTTFIILPVKL